MHPTVLLALAEGAWDRGDVLSALFLAARLDILGKTEDLWTRMEFSAAASYGAAHPYHPLAVREFRYRWKRCNPREGEEARSTLMTCVNMLATSTTCKAVGCLAFLSSDGGTGPEPPRSSLPYPDATDERTSFFLGRLRDAIYAGMAETAVRTADSLFVRQRASDEKARYLDLKGSPVDDAWKCMVSISEEQGYLVHLRALYDNHAFPENRIFFLLAAWCCATNACRGRSLDEYIACAPPEGWESAYRPPLEDLATSVPWIRSLVDDIDEKKDVDGNAADTLLIERKPDATRLNPFLQRVRDAYASRRRGEGRYSYRRERRKTRRALDEGTGESEEESSNSSSSDMETDMSSATARLDRAVRMDSLRRAIGPVFPTFLRLADESARSPNLRRVQQREGPYDRYAPTTLGEYEASGWIMAKPPRLPGAAVARYVLLSDCETTYNCVAKGPYHTASECKSQILVDALREVVEPFPRRDLSVRFSEARCYGREDTWYVVRESSARSLPHTADGKIVSGTTTEEIAGTRSLGRLIAEGRPPHAGILLNAVRLLSVWWIAGFEGAALHRIHVTENGVLFSGFETSFLLRRTPSRIRVETLLLAKPHTRPSEMAVMETVARNASTLLGEYKAWKQRIETGRRLSEACARLELKYDDLEGALLSRLQLLMDVVESTCIS
jgi:hypothetical protein